MEKDSLINSIESFVKEDDKLSKEIFGQIMMYIYQTETQSDLYLLFKLLGFDKTIEMVDYFSGRKIKLPTRKELADLMKWSIILYLRDHKNYEWKDIKSFLDTEGYEEQDFFDIKIKYKIDSIRKRMNRDLFEVLNKIGNERLLTFYKELDKGKTNG